MADVLLVDDSSYTRERLQDALTDLDATLHQAESGDAARRIIDTLDPDCILLDLLMVGTGGMELLRVLREDGDDTPVIIVSAFIDDDVREEAEGLDVHAFIQKPFDEATVRDAVRVALEQ